MIINGLVVLVNCSHSLCLSDCLLITRDTPEDRPPKEL